MSKGRVTQHRAKRDINTSENRELKKEIETLQRTIARLRKENEKLRSNTDNEPIAQAEDNEEEARSRCPICKEVGLSTITIPGGKTVIVCGSCKKYRKVSVCP